mmetsp:Transcript_21525/g.63533  ORF Transcript_21525/g.63533 Transcript_21525/m.63533 type:complete len:264 (+) Transcript_21525:271-1062(+)
MEHADRQQFYKDAKADDPEHAREEGVRVVLAGNHPVDAHPNHAHRGDGAHENAPLVAVDVSATILGRRENGENHIGGLRGRGVRGVHDQGARGLRERGRGKAQEAESPRVTSIRVAVHAHAHPHWVGERGVGHARRKAAQRRGRGAHGSDHVHGDEEAERGHDEEQQHPTEAVPKVARQAAVHLAQRGLPGGHGIGHGRLHLPRNAHVLLHGEVGRDAHSHHRLPVVVHISPRHKARCFTHGSRGARKIVSAGPSIRRGVRVL